MSEPRKRGRRPVADKRRQVPLALNAVEQAQIDTARARWHLEAFPPGQFLRMLVLAAVQSQEVRYLIYQDSGLIEREDAADWAAAMQELAPDTPAERE